MESRLRDTLREARSRGYLGAADLDEVIAHALGYLESLPELPSRRAADLGSGGGVPGLVLAVLGPTTIEWTLVERSQARSDFLVRAVSRLGLNDRVSVVSADALDFARGEGRGRFGLVVARSFLPLAEVVELAAPLLVVGGRLITTLRPRRAPRSEVTELSLQCTRIWELQGVRYVEFTCRAAAGRTFPRPTAKRRAAPIEADAPTQSPGAGRP